MLGRPYGLIFVNELTSRTLFDEHGREGKDAIVLILTLPFIVY